jgi:nascent polypeptide-associated complex subunit alpha
MFGSIDPKKIQSMMKQMGIAQEEVAADKVIIEKSEGGRIIINNPQVLKVKMQGNENFQISGEVTEESDEEESEEDKLEEDIKTIVEQTQVDKEIAAIELEKCQGDIAQAIINLSKNKKK